MHICVSTNLFTAFDYIKLDFLNGFPRSQLKCSIQKINIVDMNLMIGMKNVKVAQNYSCMASP